MFRQIDRCCVRAGSSIREAMLAIENGNVGIALVLDGDRRLLGTVTDGDLRRAILGGAALSSPVESHAHRGFTSVGPEAGRAEVLDLMQALLLKQVPVLDKDRRVLGLHVLHELIGAVERSTWAVVMAGGKGTRLRPITETLPKPMVKVAGRPILERLVLHLVGFGIKRIFLSINYLGKVIEDHFGDGARLGCRIDYLRDDKDAMGTGGALSLLPALPKDPLLVLNGDLVTQANLESLLDFHADGRFAATMGVRRYLHPVPFGCVETQDGRVLRFEEKPTLEKSVNAGIYVLNPEVVGRVPKRAYPITALFEECLDKGEPVGAYEIQEDWIDVGQRDQLREAQQGPAGGHP